MMKTTILCLTVLACAQAAYVQIIYPNKDCSGAPHQATAVGEKGCLATTGSHNNIITTNYRVDGKHLISTTYDSPDCTGKVLSTIDNILNECSSGSYKWVIASSFEVKPTDKDVVNTIHLDNSCDGPSALTMVEYDRSCNGLFGCIPYVEGTSFIQACGNETVFFPSDSATTSTVFIPGTSAPKFGKFRL